MPTIYYWGALMQQTEKRVSAHIMENNNFCGGAQQRCIKLDWLNFLSLSSHGNPKLTEEFLTNSRILFQSFFSTIVWLAQKK